MRIYCEHCHEIFSVTPEQKKSEVDCPACGAKRLCPETLAAPGVVLGDFLIEKSLTTGGMGEIFVARQLSLDREVALKVLLEKFSQDADSAESLLHEARAAAKLNHPNIVQAYAVGSEDGVLYFAMELIRGETCKDLLKRKKRLDGLDAAKIVLDVARALDAAWGEQKIVHQDIKPENIMLDASGFAKLADLGLARRAGSDAECNAEEVMGTPQYISPEQLTCVPTDVRSDIYSLGATFYHFVTGRFPYVAPTTDEITRMHVEGNLQPPIEVYDHLSIELNRIILKMMARNIEERYQSPKELIADLEAFIQGEAAAKTRNVKVRPPWSRRKKWIVFGGGGALLLLLLLTTLILGSVFASSPKIPVFARKFFLDCHQKGVDFGRKCQKLITPEVKPVMREVKITEYTGRKELFQSGKALLDRFQKGEVTIELLQEFDAFSRKYPLAKTKKEREMILQVSLAAGRADELLREAPMRKNSVARYQETARAVAAHRKAEKLRMQENQRQLKLEAEKEARLRAEILQKQQAEAKARALADQAALAEKTAKADAVLHQVGRQLFVEFVRCAARNERAKFERELNRPVKLPQDVEYNDVKSSVEYFERYRSALKKMFPDYLRFLEQLKKLDTLGISVSIPPHGICYITSVSPQRIGHFRTIGGVEFDFPLDERHHAETVRFLNAFGRSLGWQNPGSPAAFYYALYTGALTPGAKRFAPADFWHIFAEPMKLEIPSP